MEQEKRLDYLLEYLCRERPEDIRIPDGYPRKRALYRSLVNVRPPTPIADDFIAMQDAFLQEETRQKGIVRLKDIPQASSDGRILLLRGDITRLEADAIVNAANNQLLGCFIPCHGCVDNAIHTAAGVQLRRECYEIMQKQGQPEEAGKAKITRSYNLPCNFVIHTVGPIVSGKLTRRECDLLASCHRSCLEIASEHQLRSIAFCCISTGEFHFPNEEAAQIAVYTAQKFLAQNQTSLQKIVFNVYKDTDYMIYDSLL